MRNGAFEERELSHALFRARSGAPMASLGADHALRDVLDISEIARMAPWLNTWTGVPSRMFLINKNSAMSGRPRGP